MATPPAEPIDRRSREIVYCFSGDFVRGLPRSTWVMHAVAHGAAAAAQLGPYTMEHTPWPGTGV